MVQRGTKFNADLQHAVMVENFDVPEKYAPLLNVAAPKPASFFVTERALFGSLTCAFQGKAATDSDPKRPVFPI
jgi:hypothetical protein